MPGWFSFLAVKLAKLAGYAVYAVYASYLGYPAWLCTLYWFFRLAMQAGYAGDYAGSIRWLAKLFCCCCYAGYGGNRCWLQ
jgi:hypothetical protein